MLTSSPSGVRVLHRGNRGTSVLQQRDIYRVSIGLPNLSIYTGHFVIKSQVEIRRTGYPTSMYNSGSYYFVLANKFHSAYGPAAFSRFGTTEKSFHLDDRAC